MTAWTNDEPVPEFAGLSMAALLDYWTLHRNDRGGQVAADEVCRRLLLRMAPRRFLCTLDGMKEATHGSWIAFEAYEQVFR